MNENQHNHTVKELVARSLALITIPLLYVLTSDYRFDISGFVTISVPFWASVINTFIDRKLTIALVLTTLHGGFFYYMVVESPHMTIQEKFLELFTMVLVAFLVALLVGIVINGLSGQRIKTYNNQSEGTKTR